MLSLKYIAWPTKLIQPPSFRIIEKQNNSQSTILSFLKVKLLYNSKCPSVRPKRFWENVNFQLKCVKFSVKISLTNKHLFFKQFFGLSVGSGFAIYERTRPCLYTFFFKYLSL